jgi:hypothetical protein
MTISCEAVPVPVVVASQSVEICSHEGITSLSLAVHEYCMRSNMCITVIGPTLSSSVARSDAWFETFLTYNSSRKSII